MDLVVIAHNIRSAHNIGALLRTSDGLGIGRLYITGYSPYPPYKNDSRLPHIAARVARQIEKTALGAENHQPWIYEEDVVELINSLRHAGYRIVGLEQHETAAQLPSYAPHVKTALLLGEEVSGIDKQLLGLCDDIVEIPMSGKKESFNVAQAAAIALYALQYGNSRH